MIAVVFATMGALDTTVAVKPTVHGKLDTTVSVKLSVQNKVLETRVIEVNHRTMMYPIGVVRSAVKGDTISFLLHSPGGNVYAGFGLIERILETKAKTTGYIPVYCYSMCAMISLHIDKVRLASNAQIMFHLYGYQGYKAKPGTWLSKIDPSMNTYFIETFKLMKKQGLLTDLEYRGIIKGYDMYIDGKEYNKRLARIGK